MQLPESVEVTTGENPVGSVIWLHGLGADGHDFEPIVPELRLPRDLPLRFVFPHAPVRPVTINGGMAMRAWYDILSLDTEGRADAQGVRDSTALLQALIDREIERGIDAKKIVVAGFSQGGAIAINAVLHSKLRFGGLMALSTYIALPGELGASAGNRGIPVFMAHGSFDPMLPMQWGRASADKLAEAGFSVEWHDYPMAHAVCAEEIDDIRAWLLSVLAPVKSESRT
ncbi:MAG: alpha/beta fold hydrolase [Gammaproteobacteria bacterium]|nr:alpha/beta fold hydrolase [Gammaproteobacteria bacterium]MBT8111339.1 alpha/beta fold hydrolase [Gammaproteobacteria bacterium]NNL46037.1 alpha/beta fold hydrolase [Woeseiaceae bacterium]